MLLLNSAIKTLNFPAVFQKTIKPVHIRSSCKTWPDILSIVWEAFSGQFKGREAQLFITMFRQPVISPIKIMLNFLQSAVTLSIQTVTWGPVTGHGLFATGQHEWWAGVHVQPHSWKQWMPALTWMVSALTAPLARTAPARTPTTRTNEAVRVPDPYTKPSPLLLLSRPMLDRQAGMSF